MKIAVVGGGSTYTPELVDGLGRMRDVLPVEELAKQLQVKGEPVMEAVAITGQGVFETLREVAKMVLAELKKGG